MTELDLQARDLLRRFPLIDGHNDLPWELRERARRGGGDVSTLSLAPGDPAAVNLAEPVAGTHTDLPRLAVGGVGAQFWSVYVPASLAGDGAVAAVLEQIDVVRRIDRGLPRGARTGADRGRRGADLRLRPGGLAARCRRWPRHRRVARRAADAVRARRQVPDADPQRQRRLGRFGHRQAAGRRADRVRPGCGPRDATDRHARRPFARRGFHDAPCAGRGPGPGDLLALQRQGGHRQPAQRARRRAGPAGRQRRRLHGDVRARLRVAGVRGLGGRVKAEVAAAAWIRGTSASSTASRTSGRRPIRQATLAQVADHVEHVRRVAGVEHVGLGGDSTPPT